MIFSLGRPFCGGLTQGHSFEDYWQINPDDPCFLLLLWVVSWCTATFAKESNQNRMLFWVKIIFCLRFLLLDCQFKWCCVRLEYHSNGWCWSCLFFHSKIQALKKPVSKLKVKSEKNSGRSIQCVQIWEGSLMIPITGHFFKWLPSCWLFNLNQRFCLPPEYTSQFGFRKYWGVEAMGSFGKSKPPMNCQSWRKMKSPKPQVFVLRLVTHPKKVTLVLL